MKIECKSLKGESVFVNSSQISFRVSVYAVVKHASQVLLVKGKTSGKYWFPGGGVEPHESFDQTLTRELQEETGLVIENPRLIHFEEEFFYHDVWQEAFHSLRFYYACDAGSTELIGDADVIGGESEKPRWVEVEGLVTSDFDQAYGLELIDKT